MRSVFALLTQGRLGRAAATSASGAIAAALTLVTQLTITPILLRHLGEEAFGLLMAMNAMVALFAWTDLGVGWTLVNRLAGREPGSGPDDQRAIATNAIALCAASGLAVSFLLVGLLLGLPPSVTFNVPLPLAASFQGASLVLSLCAATTALTGLAARLHVSQQRGYIANLWDVAARAVVLAGVLLAATYGANLVGILAIMCLTPCAFAAASLISAVIRQYPWLRPSRLSLSLSEARSLLRTGAPFCLLQIASAAAFSADPVLIAHLGGPSLVDDYVIVRTPFAIMSAGASIICMPLWPAYRDAISRHDFAWTRKVYAGSLAVVAVAVAAGAIIMAIWSRELFSIWLGRPTTPDPNLLWGFSAFTLCAALGNANSMLLNAAGILKLQVITAVLMATVGLAVKTWLFSKLGIAGVIWGGFAVYLTVSLVPCLAVSLQWLRRHTASPTDVVAPKR
jgi:O-antigen/teichoic acid export membrane protein